MTGKGVLSKEVVQTVRKVVLHRVMAQVTNGLRSKESQSVVGLEKILQNHQYVRGGQIYLNLLNPDGGFPFQNCKLITKCSFVS